MHLQAAVVLDEAEFAEFVHEVADTRARGTDHLRQRLLADLRDDHLGLSGLAKIGQKQKQTGQPFLAGIEELVHQVLLDADIAR